MAVVQATRLSLESGVDISAPPAVLGGKGTLMSSAVMLDSSQTDIQPTSLVPSPGCL
jgi:hypothetical protein